MKSANGEKAEKEKGFINEMRMVAMKLHTPQQAPKEGEAREAPKRKEFLPTKEGYLRFLVESKVVYDVLERAVHQRPEYAAFCSTGLERSLALESDIKWFETKYGMKAPEPVADGPGVTYAKKIEEAARSDPPAFICHYYNFYFAHTAGGRMIGGKVGQMLQIERELSFYKWEGDVAVLLDAVRAKINTLAENWAEEQKKHCLEETESSFKYSGKIMECISS